MKHGRQINISSRGAGIGGGLLICHGRAEGEIARQNHALGNKTVSRSAAFIHSPTSGVSSVGGKRSISLEPLQEHVTKKPRQSEGQLEDLESRAEIKERSCRRSEKILASRPFSSARRDNDANDPYRGL